MRHTVAFVALAAGLGQVDAHWGGFNGNWGGAPSYSTPGNTDNQCDDKMKSGFNFQDLPTGNFDAYGGMKWKGFSCANNHFGKRDNLFFPRTFGGSKCITGRATHDRDSSPRMSCDTDSKASVKEFHVAPEFDCDLEFHFGMPDGSTCKHRAPCSKSGSVISNTQCGGAKDVSVVYPHQEGKPSGGCNVAIPSVVFDCDSAQPTTPPASSTSPPETTSTPESTPATSSVPDTTTSSVPDTTTAATSSTLQTLPPPQTPSSSDSSSASSYPGSSSVPVTGGVTDSSSTTVAPTTTPSDTPATSSSVPATTSTGSTTETTASSYPPTTLSSSSSSSSSTAPGTSPSQPPSNTPGDNNGDTTCPGVVPSCLNTWVVQHGCKDNSDSQCFCPNSDLLGNVFNCLYARGESDDQVSSAISYLQGICAPYADQNPAIVTVPATITSMLTVTVTPTPTPAPGTGGDASGDDSGDADEYTTIHVTATQVVPCTDSAGAPIPSSSTTVTSSYTVSAPVVGFTTNTDTPGTTSIGMVAGPSAAAPAAGGSDSGSGSGSYPTAVAAASTSTPAGAPATYPTVAPGAAGGAAGGSSVSGAVPAATTSGAGAAAGYPTGTAIPTAGAARVGHGLGLFGAAVVAMAVL